MASGVKYTQPTSLDNYPFLQRLVQTSTQLLPTTNVMMNTDRILELPTFLRVSLFQFTVGSNPESSYVLNDMRISDVHAVLERGDGAWNVTNTGDGDVILNGNKLDKNSSENLKDGDVLRFTEMDHTFRFVEKGRPKITPRPPPDDPGNTCCWIWTYNSDPCCAYCDCDCHCCDGDDVGVGPQEGCCDCGDCSCGDCDCGDADCGGCCECLICACDCAS